MQRLGPWSLLVLWWSSGMVVAQEALRSAVVGDRAYDQRQLAAATGTPRVYAPDRMHWGPVLFNVGVSLAAEWNDNIRVSQVEQLKDYIIRPQADLDLLWPITPKATLRAGVGIGYEKYVQYDEYDRLNVIPDSEIAVDMLLGDTVVTVFDRISYSQDVISQPEITGQATYPRFENTAGFRASRIIEDWLIQGGYSHYNYIAFDDFYEYLDRSSEMFFLRGGYMIGPRTSVGLEGSCSYSDYNLDIRNDFINFSAGPYLDWVIIDPLRLTLRGGYTEYFFYDSAVLPAQDNTDGYYAQVALDHRLTESVTHNLSIVHSIDVGIESDLTERTRGTYGISWRFVDPASVSVNGFFERGQESGYTIGAAEDYDQFGGGMGLSYSLTDRIRPSLSYSYTRRTSNLAGRDYDRNLVSLRISYVF